MRMHHRMADDYIDAGLLRDGRSIGFAEYGTPTGAPIFWFPGTPGGRRQIPPRARKAAEQRSVRLIAVERPGIDLELPAADVLAENTGDVGDLQSLRPVDQIRSRPAQGVVGVAALVWLPVSLILAGLAGAVTMGFGIAGDETAGKPADFEAARALSLTALNPRPGGNISPFWEPVTAQSTPHSSMRKSIDAIDDTPSTNNSAGCPAASSARRASASRRFCMRGATSGSSSSAWMR